MAPDAPWENQGLPLDVARALRAAPRGLLWNSPHDNRAMGRVKKLVERLDEAESEDARRSRRILKRYCHDLYEAGNRDLISELGWDTDAFIRGRRGVGRPLPPRRALDLWCGPLGVGPFSTKRLPSSSVTAGTSRATARVTCYRVLERIVLHIGMHKTGTTAIQVSLGKAYDSLLARGILYPRAGRLGPGHARLARELLETDAPLAEVPSHLEILEEAQTTRPATLVVSSEQLLGVHSPRPVEWASHLCEELQPRRVDVLGYVRPQWDQTQSLYAEEVKTGVSWKPFEQTLERMMTQKRLDYLETFRPWRQAFGDRLELRPYRADLLLDGDAVADFWSSVGLGAPPELRRHANPRTGARTTEMLRLLRAFMADHHLDVLLPQPAETGPRTQQKAVQETLRRAHQRIEAGFSHDRPFSPLTQEIMVRLAAHFAASNEQLVKTYLGGRHQGLFSPPKELKAPSTWSLGEASQDERRFFTQLVAETLAEMAPSPTEPQAERGLRRGSSTVDLPRPRFAGHLG